MISQSLAQRFHLQWEMVVFCLFDAMITEMMYAQWHNKQDRESCHPRTHFPTNEEHSMTDDLEGTISEHYFYTGSIIVAVYIYSRIATGMFGLYLS